MQTVMDERQQQFTPPAPKPGFEICKRIFDIVMSAMALILLSPLFLITALAVWVQDGGNPIYSQIRLTKGGKPFKMYKFRSLRMDAEALLDELMDSNEMTGPAF